MCIQNIIVVDETVSPPPGAPTVFTVAMHLQDASKYPILRAGDVVRCHRGTPGFNFNGIRFLDIQVRRRGVQRPSLHVWSGSNDVPVSEETGVAVEEKRLRGGPAFTDADADRISELRAWAHIKFTERCIFTNDYCASLGQLQENRIYPTYWKDCIVRVKQVVSASDGFVFERTRPVESAADQFESPLEPLPPQQDPNSSEVEVRLGFIIEDDSTQSECLAFNISREAERFLSGTVKAGEWIRLRNVQINGTARRPGALTSEFLGMNLGASEGKRVSLTPLPHWCRDVTNRRHHMAPLPAHRPAAAQEQQEARSPCRGGAASGGPVAPPPSADRVEDAAASAAT
eukprot:GHVU01029512.1.p1 GENE.GHVU01029512.1~~GHVU01029512.1.p1  ORF type:complete len:344 (-),score=62.54 GHVU01029512.1:459-1490(-)